MEAVPGYLSLHQNADVMTLKWTPNQLMNGSVGDIDYERRCRSVGIFPQQLQSSAVNSFCCLEQRHYSLFECRLLQCVDSARDYESSLISALWQPAGGCFDRDSARRVSADQPRRV